MSTIQNSSVQDLAKAITDQFVLSIPKIISEMNIQKKKGQSGGDGTRGSDQSKFDHDLANRLKRERDITATIQKQLGLRNQELILLRERNKQVEKEIRSHGTYNNQTSRLFKTMASTMDEVNTKMYNFFKKIDNMSDSAKNTALMFKMVKDDLDKAISEGKTPTQRKQILDPMVNTLNDMLKALSNRIEDSDMSRQEKDSDKNIISNIQTDLASGDFNLMESAFNKAQRLMGMINNEMSVIQQGVGAHRRSFASIENTNNSIGQHIDFIETLTAKFGDRLGENDDLMGKLDDLNHQRTMLQKESNKILNDSNISEAEKAAKFAELSDSFKTLDNNLAGLSKTIVEKTKPTLMDLGRDIKESFKTGKDSEGNDVSDGFVGKKVGEFFSSKMPPQLKAIMAAASGAKLLGRAAIDIAEDQRIVQKFGVRMQSLFTNFDNAVSTGLKTSEFAEWSFKNRMNNMSVGGQDSGTDQFRKLMTTGGIIGSLFSDVKETRMQHRGKSVSLSQLLGGDSNYQAESYGSMFDMLSTYGIKATGSKMGSMFAKDGGMVDKAYQTGQLPIDLMNYITSLSDNVYTVAQLTEKGSENFIDSVAQFQIFGRTVGLNTEATKLLNKTMLDNTKNSAPDLIRRSVMFSNLLQMYGIKGKALKDISPLGRLQGQYAADYLKKMPESSVKVLQKFLADVAIQQSTAMGTDGLEINRLSANTQQLLTMFPTLGTLIEGFNPLINGMLEERKKLADLKDKNNLDINATEQEAAQAWFKSTTAWDDNIVSRAVLLSRPITNAGDLMMRAAEKMNFATSDFGLYVNRVMGIGDSSIKSIYDSKQRFMNNPLLNGVQYSQDHGYYKETKIDGFNRGYEIRSLSTSDVMGRLKQNWDKYQADSLAQKQILLEKQSQGESGILTESEKRINNQAILDYNASQADTLTKILSFFQEKYKNADDQKLVDELRQLLEKQSKGARIPTEHDKNYKPSGAILPTAPK